MSASFVSPALRVAVGKQKRRGAVARRASHSVVRAAASVEEFAGEGGLPAVKLTSSDGNTAVAYLFGGVVTSFVKDGRDVLYVRPDAVFNKSKPISGGLPHCWPQFGPGDIQVHGFARNVDWWGNGKRARDASDTWSVA